MFFLNGFNALKSADIFPFYFFFYRQFLLSGKYGFSLTLLYCYQDVSLHFISNLRRILNFSDWWYQDNNDFASDDFLRNVSWRLSSREISTFGWGCVCVSLYTIAFGEYMNPTVFSPTIDKL